MSFCCSHCFWQLVHVGPLALCIRGLATSLSPQHIQSNLEPVASRHGLSHVHWYASVCQYLALACSQTCSWYKAKPSESLGIRTRASTSSSSSRSGVLWLLSCALHTGHLYCSQSRATKSLTLTQGHPCLSFRCPLPPWRPAGQYIASGKQHHQRGLWDNNILHGKAA